MQEMAAALGFDSGIVVFRRRNRAGARLRLRAAARGPGNLGGRNGRDFVRGRRSEDDNHGAPVVAERTGEHGDGHRRSNGDLRRREILRASLGSAPNEIARSRHSQP